MLQIQEMIMEFGFGHVLSEHYQNHVALVRVAEELGYDYAWIPDQTFYRDPYVVMAAMGLATERIQIGVGVTNPYTRHPAMAARAIATLDEVAPGRIHLGVGAGNRKELLNPLGLDSSYAAAKCREMVELVRALLSGETVDYRGEHYQAVEIPMDFQARPDIPLHIAGRGALVLQAAGEVADGVIIGGLCTPKGIGYALKQVNKGANKSGRDRTDMHVVSWVTIDVTEDRESALHDIRPVVAHIIGGAPLGVLQAIDLPMDTVETIKAIYVDEGIDQAAKHVTEECIDAFTIIGDAQTCIERIRSLSEAGVTQVSMLMPPGSVAQYEQRLRHFADAIFPAFA
jgi:5,10-methylenetetrahydromethanopterin reductase